MKYLTSISRAVLYNIVLGFPFTALPAREPPEFNVSVGKKHFGVGAGTLAPTLDVGSVDTAAKGFPRTALGKPGRWGPGKAVNGRARPSS